MTMMMISRKGCVKIKLPHLLTTLICFDCVLYIELRSNLINFISNQLIIELEF